MQSDAHALSLLEKETLETISRIGTFAKLGAIHSDAKKYSQRGAWPAKGHVNAHLSFEIQAGLRSDKKNPSIRRRFDISALVESDNSKAPVTKNASYSVVLCDGTDPQNANILRKFHFDYESVETRNTGEPKPTTHLQICGEFSSHHVEKVGFRAEQIEGWHPAFEKPRIPVQPTCLVLLLNWIFLEFQRDPAISVILMDGQWKTLVRKAERQVLLPYFQQASDFLSGAGTNQHGFIRTHQYEMAI
jgi:hypothetical protein